MLTQTSKEEINEIVIFFNSLSTSEEILKIFDQKLRTERNERKAKTIIDAKQELGFFDNIEQILEIQGVDITFIDNIRKGIARQRNNNRFLLTGNVQNPRTGFPLVALKIEAYDININNEEGKLGSSITDEQGNFVLRYKDNKTFKNHMQKYSNNEIDLLLKISNKDGKELLKETKLQRINRLTPQIIKLYKPEIKIRDKRLDQVLKRLDFNTKQIKKVKNRIKTISDFKFINTKNFSKEIGVKEINVEKLKEIAQFMEIPLMDIHSAVCFVYEGLTFDDFQELTPEKLQRLLEKDVSEGKNKQKKVIDKKTLKFWIDVAKRFRPDIVKFKEIIDEIQLSKNELKILDRANIKKLSDIRLKKLNVKSVSKKLSKSTIDKLESHSRLQLISNDVKLNQKLINANLNTIIKISRSTISDLIKSSDGLLSKTKAKQMKTKAITQSSYLANILADKLVQHSPAHHGWETIFPEIGPQSVRSERHSLVSNNILPDEDRCPECEECRSVFSPICYLFDLINILANSFLMGLNDCKKRFYQDFGSINCENEISIRQIELAIQVLERFIYSYTEGQSWELMTENDRIALYRSFFDLTGLELYPDVIIDLYDSTVQQLGTSRTEIYETILLGEQMKQELATKVYLDPPDLDFIDITNAEITIERVQELREMLRKAFYKKYEELIYQEYRVILKIEKEQTLEVNLASEIANKENEILAVLIAGLDPTSENYEADLAEAKKIALNQATSEIRPLWLLLKQEKFAELTESGIDSEEVDIQATSYANETYDEIKQELIDSGNFTADQVEELLRKEELTKTLNRFITRELGLLQSVITNESTRLANEEVNKAIDKAKTGLLFKIRTNLIHLALQLDNIPATITNTKTLGNYLHIDFSGQECTLTSPTAQAIQTIQSFIHSARMGNEQVDLNEFDENQWKWMSTYGLWHALQMVFFYPENFLLPDVRRGATASFNNIIDRLEEIDLDNDSMASEIASYIREIGNTYYIHILGSVKYQNDTYLLGVDWLSVKGHVLSYEEINTKKFYFGVIKNNIHWTGWQEISSLEEIEDIRNWRFFSHENMIYLYNLEPHIDEDDEESSAITTWYFKYLPITILSDKTLSVGGIKVCKNLMYSNTSINDTKMIAMYPNKWRKYDTDPSFIILAVYRDLSHVNSYRTIYSFYLVDSEFNCISGGGRILEQDIPWQEQHLYLSITPVFLSNANRLHVLIYRQHQESLLIQHISSDIYNIDDFSDNIHFVRSNLVVHNPVQALYPIELTSIGRTLIFHSFPDGGYNDPFGLHFTVFNHNTESLELLQERSNHTFEFFDTIRNHGYGGSPSINYSEDYYLCYNHKRDFPMGVVAVNEYMVRVFTAHGKQIFLTFDESPNLGILNWSEYLSPERLSWAEFPLPKDWEKPNSFEKLRRLFNEQTDLRTHFSDNSIPKVYFDELFFYLPLRFADKLAELRKFDQSIEWYRLLYDPFKPNLADRLIYKGFETSQGGWHSTYRTANPFDPYWISYNRKSALLRHVIFKIVGVILDWADSEFIKDTGEARNKARELYEIAQDILALDEAPTDFCGEHWDNFLISVITSFNFSNRQVEQLLESSLLPLRNNTSQNLIKELIPQVSEILETNTNSILKISKIHELVQELNIRRKQSPTILDKVKTIDKQSRILEMELVSIAEHQWVYREYEEEGDDENVYLGTDILSTPILISVFEEEPVPVLSHYMFCVPTNPLLAILRFRIESNLEKLRTCLNIAGMSTSFQLYSTPMDPTQLIETIAAGGSIEDAIPSTPVPIYRYSYLVDYTRYLISLAMHLESQFLGAEEKYWQSAYEILKARQDLELSKSHVTLEALRVKEASDSVRIAVYQQEKVISQLNHYKRLIKSGRLFNESAAYGLLIGAAVAYSASAIFRTSSAAVGVWKFWQSEKTAQELAAATTSIGQALSASSSAFAMYASFQRREEEWRYQLNLANNDFKIVKQGITLANHRVEIAEKSRDIAELRSEQMTDTLEFLQNERFTGPKLYDWMRAELKKIYRDQLYNAIAVARMAQMALSFERQQPLNYIRTDYWDSDKYGLLGAEKLLNDVNEMDKFRITTKTRKKELTKTISISSLAPAEFQRFKETGVIYFAPQMEWFDRNFPGHYMRLIKRVNVSVVALIPPSEQIHGTLSDNGFSTVMVGAPFKEFKTIFRQPESISITLTHNATGLFEASLKDEMLLPFEGKGVDTAWTFELPKGANRFDYNTLIDVLLTIEYTALDDRAYRRKVLEKMGIDDNGWVNTEGMRFFSIKYHYPDQWYHFKNPSNGDRNLIIQLSSEDFPPNETIIKIEMVNLVSTQNKVENIDVRIEFSELADTIDAIITDGYLQDEHIKRKFNAYKPFGQWTFTVIDDELADELEDLIFVVSYKAKILYNLN